MEAEENCEKKERAERNCYVLTVNNTPPFTACGLAERTERNLQQQQGEGEEPRAKLSLENGRGKVFSCVF